MSSRSNPCSRSGRVSWNNYQQPRWAKADEPAIKAAIEAGGGTYIRTDAQDKEDQQLADIDTLIAKGAKVLIVLAKDNKAILPAIEKAKAANIPVIGYDRLIEDERLLHHVRQRRASARPRPRRS